MRFTYELGNSMSILEKQTGSVYHVGRAIKLSWRERIRQAWWRFVGKTKNVFWW
jgi:hypothetical protein